MAANNPLIGKQIGNYRILAEINSGSFGSVYQGKHIIFEDDPMVAIKLLHTALRSQQEHAEFIKEAQVLRKLQHPHILRILDAGIQDGVPYLVTEYAAGGSLRNRLNTSNGKPISSEEAINILTQIGQALHYAHERHIIHRDLKPENILFNQMGEVLLADFGIAVLLASTHTGLVSVSGTPPYMAPEQFEGLAGTKSDQYSLGCIAYELVTGRRLFTIPNGSLEAYWFHHAKVEPIPPTSHNPQLPAHIERAILTSLAKDRTHRHSDVHAFIEALLTIHSQKTKQDWLQEGIALYNLKRYEEALTAFEQTIRLYPNYAVAYGGKGNTLRNLKRYEEALTAYEQAVQLDPNFAYAYYNKGTALRNLKRYEEALAAYGQAILLNPNYADAYNNKGNTLYELKRYEEALTAYEQVIHLDPNSADAYNNKGATLRNLKRYEEALTAFEQAIHFDPNCVLAYHNKSTTLQTLGRSKEAQQALEKARQLGYNG
jgi:tetratricopeptide (TPR) repeat protein